MSESIDHSDLPEVPEATGGVGTAVSTEDVTEAMKDVVDPELGINVVDLGLVYGVHVEEDSNVVIDMTLTSAACPTLVLPALPNGVEVADLYDLASALVDQGVH